MSRILVVDDEPDVARILRLALGPRHTVIVAGDGAGGLAALQAQRPDLVVLDLMMPRLDGFTFLGQLSSAIETTVVPVLVLSAVATSDARERCLQLGATGFFTKPFDPYAVADVIESVLASQTPAQDTPSAAGGDGRVYVAGTASRSPLFARYQDFDVVVQEPDGDGHLVWTRVFGDPRVRDFDTSGSVAVGSRRVIVTGSINDGSQGAVWAFTGMGLRVWQHRLGPCVGSADVAPWHSVT